jgi:Flp pilus assembly protein TadD
LDKYTRLFHEDPNDPGLLKSYGSLLAELGRNDEAAAAYNLAVGLQPDDPSARKDLGDVLHRLGRNAEAEAAYRKAAELDSGTAEYQNVLGHFLCYTMGQPEKALPALQEAVRLAPNKWHAHYDVGSAYAFVGQWDKSIPAYRRAVALNPASDPEARYRLAALCLHVGDVDGYRATCREMLEQFGTSPNRNFIDRTAKICLLARDPDENRDRALMLADQNVLGTEKHPDYRWFIVAKALADYRANRFAEALKRLEQFVPNKGGGNSDALSFALFAMVHQRLDHHDKARGALANAKDMLTDTMPDPGKGRPFGDDWNDWLHCQILVREAEEMIVTNVEGSNRRD